MYMHVVNNIETRLKHYTTTGCRMKIKIMMKAQEKNGQNLFPRCQVIDPVTLLYEMLSRFASSHDRIYERYFQYNIS